MHSAAAIPLVRFEAASESNALPGAEQVTQRLVGNTPGDTLDPPGIVLRREAQMVGTDTAHARWHHIGHCKNWFWRARAERPQRGHLIIKRGRRAARREDGIDVQVQRRIAFRLELGHVGDHPRVKGWYLVRLKAEPSGHRMAAAGEDDTFAGCR